MVVYQVAANWEKWYPHIHVCAIICVIFVPLTLFQFVGVNCIHDQNIFASSFEDLQSFVIFRNFRKMFGKYSETFVWPSNKLEERLEIFGKLSKTLQEI